MLPANTVGWGAARSCIRTLAEYGAVRKKEIGAENVYDFSLGNPSIPAPDCVNGAIAELLKGDSVALHGYTTAAGVVSLREKIAEELNGRYGTHLTPDHLYVTCGAAAALCIALRAVLFPGDEVIVPAPFFPEYRVFTEASGGVLVPVPPRGDLQIDVEALERALTPRTRAVIINSPNNPSGVIFDEENLRALASVLRRQEEKTGEPVYLITDEPYRELVYDGAAVRSAIEFYDDTFMAYSFSKALSIPGERIGYLAVSDRMRDAGNVYYSVLGAGRALGYVNPPSLFQRVMERCLGQTADVSQYRANRDLLCAGLREIGYDFVEPQGAFYLFVKCPIPDAKEFSERAKKHELLLVPSDDFGCPGFVRIAYCVSADMIRRSMPAFRALMDEFR
jgi:aspartate aminotransferase